MTAVCHRGSTAVVAHYHGNMPDRLSTTLSSRWGSKWHRATSAPPASGWRTRGGVTLLSIALGVIGDRKH